MNHSLVCCCDQIDRLHILGRSVDRTMHDPVEGARREASGREALIGITQIERYERPGGPTLGRLRRRSGAPHLVVDLERDCDRVVARHRRAIPGRIRVRFPR
jgi:hypothetical protein